MLRYFIARQPLPTIKTPNATPFTLRCADEYTGKVIPFSHIYVASDPYSRRIKKALNGKQLKHFEELNKAKKHAIENHPRFPADLKAQNFSSVSQLRDYVSKKAGEKATVNIVVVNGIGTGFGDNFVGLGAIQRLTKLLAPTKIVFHLMQTMNQRSLPVYMRSPNVLLTNNCMDMRSFLKMDFLINLTGMLGFSEFDKMPLAQFQSHAFSINQLTPNDELHPVLKLEQQKTDSIRDHINSVFNNKRKTVLLHPNASSPVRSMQGDTAIKIARQLIKSNFNVVCAIELKDELKSKYYANVSELSRSIDDLNHIISACDAVISVGTVVYHLAAAHSKPTLLLATVKADIESAKLLPQVLTWLPTKSKKLIINKHKSREEDDLKIANKIWKNTTPKDLVNGLKKHIKEFKKNTSSEQLKAPSARPIVGVVIPQFGKQETLTRCLDSLCKVDGFDPAYLYIIDNNKKNRYFTVAVNEGIEQALNDGCDYVWVLNNDTQIDSAYLKASLTRFEKNNKIGIVGGKNLKTSKPDRIFWGGSYNAFPTGQHKAGYVSRGDLDKATRETWATFSSVIIKAQTYRDVGGLDNSMRMIFSDSDFCFSAAQKGWQTWYEPKSLILHDTGVSANGGNDTLKSIFRADKVAFFNKWKDITGCSEPEKLQGAIFTKTGFQPD